MTDGRGWPVTWPWFSYKRVRCGQCGAHYEDAIRTVISTCPNCGLKIRLRTEADVEWEKSG